jgi:hypothetical protein
MEEVIIQNGKLSFMPKSLESTGKNIGPDVLLES